MLFLIFWIWVSFAIFVIAFLAFYFSFTRIWSRAASVTQKAVAFIPKVSILIAAFNEANVIQQKIQNLEELHYPKGLLEVFVIDGASTDRTSEFAGNMQAQITYKLTVIKESIRDGKVCSLNRALPLCSGEIVVVTDADTILEREALSNLISNFGDPSIGAVAGCIYPYGSEAKQEEKVYREITNSFRVAESKFYSTFIFGGELYAARRSLIDEFDLLYDDSGTALKILAKGYRTVEDEKVKVFERLPGSQKKLFKIRSRRALYVIGVCFRSLKLIRKANSRTRLIIVLNLLMHVIVPVCSLVVLILLPSVFIQYPLTLLVLILLAALILVPPLRRMASAMYSFLLSQLELLNGLVLYLRRQDITRWDPSRDD
ncbi:MAG: glycosyltransferase [archaeon]|nr:glycosyltransferase [archaeon]